MASELERIANRLRILSAQATRQRATIHNAARDFTSTAGAIKATRYKISPDGVVEQSAPPDLLGLLDLAARRARNADGPLRRTSQLLNQFAAGLSGTTAPVAAPVPVPSGATTDGERPTPPPLGERPPPPPTAVPAPVPTPVPGRSSENADDVERRPEGARPERLSVADPTDPPVRARFGRPAGRTQGDAGRREEAPEPPVAEVPDLVPVELPDPDPEDTGPEDTADDAIRTATPITPSTASSSTEAAADANIPSYE